MKVLDALQCNQQPPSQMAFQKPPIPRHEILIQGQGDSISTADVGHDLIWGFYCGSI